MDPLRLRKRAIVALALGLVGCAHAPEPAHGPYGLGSPADARAVARVDIDVDPAGRALPAGSGTPLQGARIFATTCARCHGDAVRLAPDRWPYATTVFDYIRRAMPPDRKETLSAPEVYALTAFTLYANEEIGQNDLMDRETLPRVAMPKIKDFLVTR
jgi:cytochrome c5